MLEVGKSYLVDRIDVHSWHTKVYLRDFPGKPFNSVNFEPVAGVVDEDGAVGKSKPVVVNLAVTVDRAVVDSVLNSLMSNQPPHGLVSNFNDDLWQLAIDQQLVYRDGPFLFPTHLGRLVYQTWRREAGDVPSESAPEIQERDRLIEQCRQALVAVSQVLGLAEQGAGNSLPYALKQPKIEVDLAIIEIANVRKALGIS